jgi:6-hydroxycyclohex-1-ene-1-carbonyl-CoA dehydrogenase
MLLRVRACGLCHTDQSFLYLGVRTNAPLPLTLGHEIIGEANDGQLYIVPAVLPCGECELCRRGRGNVCRKQKMPGNDIHGGFASHIVVPSRDLCPIPSSLPEPELLSVLADAGSTAYQAVVRCGIEADKNVVVVGAGGVGGFAAQIARALGATVCIVDVDDARLESMAPFVDACFSAKELSGRDLKKAIAAFEEEQGLSTTSRRILECSGTAPGQDTAFGLLNHDAVLAIVGFTLDKPQLRLSNLMAFDATAFGNWGCLPEHYPKLLQLVQQKQVVVEPFVERKPMSQLNALLSEKHHALRPVLIPDF